MDLPESAHLSPAALAAGDLPTKAERYALLEPVRGGAAEHLTDAAGFCEMAAGARAGRWTRR